MALMKCPECEKEISDSALTCPNCGYSIAGHFRKQQESEAEKTREIEIKELAEQVKIPKVKPFINGTIIGSLCAIIISVAVFAALRFSETMMYDATTSKTVPILIIIFFLTIGFLGLNMGINQLKFIRDTYNKYKDDPENYKKEIVRHDMAEKNKKNKV